VVVTNLGLTVAEMEDLRGRLRTREQERSGGQEPPCAEERSTPGSAHHDLFKGPVNSPADAVTAAKVTARIPPKANGKFVVLGGFMR
jgi:large subunit ribosomal protein L10